MTDQSETAIMKRLDQEQRAVFDQAARRIRGFRGGIDGDGKPMSEMYELGVWTALQLGREGTRVLLWLLARKLREKCILNGVSDALDFHQEAAKLYHELYGEDQ